MKTNHLFAAMLSASLLTTTIAFAYEVPEEEPNHPISYRAQQLDAADEMIVKDAVMGAINGGTSTTDLDFYSFYGNAGDVITVDIEGGNGGQDPVDTIVAVFGASPDYQILRWNDDYRGFDSYIRNFSLPTTGTYTIGVSSYPRRFLNGGTTVTGAGVNANGDYSLVITGVSNAAAAQQVNIEVKPGNNGAWAPINPKSHGKIPVAILSTSAFNAMTVDASSLSFGSTGDENSLSKCGKGGEDVNGDGRLDMVCHFSNQAANFAVTDAEGTLKGNLKDGTAIEGRAPLKMVPQKAQF